jgi:hypothetical protein
MVSAMMAALRLLNPVELPGHAKLLPTQTTYESQIACCSRLSAGLAHRLPVAPAGLGPISGHRKGDDFPEFKYFQLRISESATGDILSPKSRNFGTRATARGKECWTRKAKGKRRWTIRAARFAKPEIPGHRAARPAPGQFGCPLHSFS